MTNNIINKIKSLLTNNSHEHYHVMEYTAFQSKVYEVQFLHKFNPNNTNRAGIETRVYNRQNGKLIHSQFIDFANIFNQADCFEVDPDILESAACLLADYTNCNYNKAIDVIPRVFNSFGCGWQYIQGWI